MNNYKTTSLGVGETATLVINDVKEGKFGPVYVGTVNGEAAYIQTSGNLKSINEKLERGEIELDKAFTITRVQDVRTKAGFTRTDFNINAAKGTTSTSAPTVAKTAVNVKDKLAAIRANRGQSSSNN